MQRSHPPRNPSPDATGALPSDAEHLARFSQRLHLIVNARRLRGHGTVTQADVHRELAAVGVEVSDGTISRWFSGKFWPANPRTALALASVLDVDPGWLYFAGFTHAEPPDALRPMLDL